MIQLHNVDLKLLRVFNAVVKFGGFSAAQASLNAAQSTISGQMAQLEMLLGVKLCDRGRSGFRLTEQGSAIHGASESLLAAVDKFRMEVDTLKNRISGHLNIGIIDNTISDAEGAIPRAMRLFRARGHDVHITVYVGSPPELETRVLDGRLHIAVGHFPFKISGLSYLPLYHETQGLYCGRDHELYRNDYRSAELKRRIISSDIVARGYLQRRDLNVLGAASAAATVDNVEAQALLILSGAYIGFLPCHYAARWLSTGDLKQLGRALIESPFEIISRRGLAAPLTVRTFLDDLGRARRA